MVIQTSFFRAVFPGKERNMYGWHEAPPEKMKEEYHELYFDCAVDLCGNDA